MKKSREYFERELGILQGYAREFAEAYPAQAMRLGMSDGASDDPHIERIIQATALTNARIAQLIDDSDGKVTEALLNINYPQYARPFPSSAIVHVDAGAAADAMSTVTRLPRGAMMSAQTPDGIPCKFRTTQDVLLASVAPARVTFDPVFHPPQAPRRHDDVVSALAIEIECRAPGVDMRGLDMPALRLLIDGEPSLCATLRDVLFLHTRAAWLELEDGRWRALDEVPLAPVGFAEDEAMVPCPAAAHPAYRLMTEYFAFAAKFHFVDVLWPALAALMPAGCRRVTLHLGLDVPRDAAAARRLGTVSRANLLPGCTPVVNLFPRSACPIELTHATPDYELAPEGTPASAYDVYSVDRVTMLRETPRGQAVSEYHPYYSLRHGEQPGRDLSTARTTSAGAARRSKITSPKMLTVMRRIIRPS